MRTALKLSDFVWSSFLASLLLLLALCQSEDILEPNVSIEPKDPVTLEPYDYDQFFDKDIPNDYIDPGQETFSLSDYVELQPPGYKETEEGKQAIKFMGSPERPWPNIIIGVERNEKQAEAYRRRLKKIEQEKNN